MYRKGVFIVFTMIVFMVNANAQHLSHHVLVPVAGVTAVDGLNYSQTIGETAVEAVGTDGYILTQGFHQPSIKLYDPDEKTGDQVRVYPNPVINYVNVELFGDYPRTYIISIININGTIMHQEKLDFTGRFRYIHEINVSRLARGIYFIRAMTKNGLISETFKIEKM